MLDLDKKELKNMPKDKIVDKYITNVTIVNDDPEFQKYMSEEEDKRKIQNSLISEAKNEGISQGVKQTAKNLLSMNFVINYKMKDLNYLLHLLMKLLLKTLILIFKKFKKSYYKHLQNFTFLKLNLFL